MWEEDYSDEEFGELPVNVKATVEATNDRVKVNVVTASLPVPDLDELSDNETEANPLLEKEQRDLDDRLQELHDSFSSEDSLLEKLRQETLAFKKPASSDVGDDASSAISKRKKPTVKPRIKRTSSSSLHDLNDAFPESFGGVSRSQSALDISQLSSVTPAPNDEAQSMNDKPASREGAEKDGLDESASIIGTAAEEDPNEDYEQYKKEELRLKAEYQSLQKSLKTELEQQEKLSVQLESASSAVSIQRRALRATKMKVRDMQEQQRQLLHWFKVVAKVAFEKEKDKANALLQRAMRILSRCTTRHDKIYAKVQAANQRLEAELEELNRVMAEHEELRDVEARLTAEVDELKLTLEREEADYLARRENVENDLKNRLLAEEALRKFEAELIAEACEKQRPGRPVDVDELDVFEAVKREVKKIPNLRNATRLTHISFENNQITSARGLEHLSNLISINLNQNKLQLLDVSPFEDVRFLSAASNALTSVQGLEKCKELVMLDLSSNPIENLSSFGEAENLQVVDLHSTKIQDYKWIERLAVLIYLDLSRTKMMDTSLEFLHSCPILQFLNLSRNGFTAIPPIYNILLRSLSFEGNFLKRLSVTTWLPRLRVLNISNNKIQHIEPLTLCPLLEELYLASNEIQEKASLFSISACTCLRVLDLTKNPISTVSDFHPIVFLLFPRLQLLNGNPTTGNAHATTPLKAIRVLEACLQLFEEGADTLADDCSPQQILEQWDDFRRICFNHQSKIDEFMGEEYEPYLKYLSCSKGQQPSKEVVMRMRMQENRMSWLGGLLQPLLLEMEDLGKNTPVGARAFLENVMVEELLWRKEEQGVILLQSCWRRRAAKKAAARRSRAIRVIQLWMRSILIKRGKIILNPLQLRGIVQMQAIWRGFMARKKKTEMVENALKEADALLRDTSMTDWISRAKDNIFDDEMRDYLGHERLRHFSAEVGSRERRQSSLKPGGIALRDSGARDSTAVDEIEVSLTQEAMEPIWMSTEVNSPHAFLAS
ncbi:hypothetical protein DFJ73DRAFT_831642 [Zopfochytrium polystomum]|nr:hypothetical protein DFJ73DRAFT_831642 [Zopfochytrium polystomum]